MDERGQRASIATWLAETACAQGRFDEALRLTEEAEKSGGPDDYEVQGRWRVTRAKLLARRGDFAAASRLAGEAVTLVPAAYDPPERAEFLLGKAEVAQSCGKPGEAEACARQALQYYENRQMLPRAEQARALLARLTEQRSTLKP